VNDVGWRRGENCQYLKFFVTILGIYSIVGAFLFAILLLLVIGFINACRYVPSDVRSIFEYDPATSSYIEALLTMPGLHALFIYRIAHFLLRMKIPYLPRFVSLIARLATAIDIHPGAKMGNGIIIDHGAGVVIGETAEVGDGCIIYQGVTLGGTGKGGKGQKSL
jgi:serine O-acetyltransferase